MVKIRIVKKGKPFGSSKPKALGSPKATSLGKNITAQDLGAEKRDPASSVNELTKPIGRKFSTRTEKKDKASTSSDSDRSMSSAARQPSNSSVNKGMEFSSNKKTTSMGAKSSKSLGKKNQNISAISPTLSSVKKSERIKAKRMVNKKKPSDDLSVPNNKKMSEDLSLSSNVVFGDKMDGLMVSNSSVSGERVDSVTKQKRPVTKDDTVRGNLLMVEVPHCDRDDVMAASTGSESVIDVTPSKKAVPTEIVLDPVPVKKSERIKARKSKKFPSGAVLETMSSTGNNSNMLVAGVTPSLVNNNKRSVSASHHNILLGDDCAQTNKKIKGKRDDDTFNSSNTSSPMVTSDNPNTKKTNQSNDGGVGAGNVPNDVADSNPSAPVEQNNSLDSLDEGLAELGLVARRREPPRSPTARSNGFVGVHVVAMVIKEPEDTATILYRFVNPARGELFSTWPEYKCSQLPYLEPAFCRRNSIGDPHLPWFQDNVPMVNQRSYPIRLFPVYLQRVPTKEAVHKLAQRIAHQVASMEGVRERVQAAPIDQFFWLPTIDNPIEPVWSDAVGLEKACDIICDKCGHPPVDQVSLGSYYARNQSIIWSCLRRSIIDEQTIRRFGVPAETFGADLPTEDNDAVMVQNADLLDDANDDNNTEDQQDLFDDES